MSGAPSLIPASVTVAVPARLHLGFLDLNGDMGRSFGSIGLAISGIETRLTASTAAHPRVVGPESDRVRAHLAAMERDLALETAHAIHVEEVVPAHAGLGSGTQIALAVAAAMRRLHGLPLDVAGDAIRLGRGARSGIGVGLFTRGGLVVDGGRGPRTGVAPIVSHLDFPEPWRVLLVIDPKRHGAHGPDEAAAFAGLPRFSSAEAAHLCRLVLMKALPALAEHDIASFGAAIQELQTRLGDHFAPTQGGNRFNSPEVAAVLERLAAEGAFGIGQSSWGPTGFAFAPSREEAQRLLQLARGLPAAQALDIRACRGLNRGAEIIVGAAAYAPES
ncbi:MAG TPA: beta-ribofuranosylaminobenzene 5'-phosphate synthase family protein [Xanthobacteraceae bacterium]|nr:beta-ribofuranosylaminobenzene 5'-phosphate synthase family protein [Xanthobacteraceae bacterium]